MQLATSSVEFSFNNNMYQQIDGVAMGSPLGPALANIFVGHQEQKLFNVVNRPLAYFRYVDDTFAVFNSEDDCNAFLSHLNSLHPSLPFTHEKESNHSLPFLDMLVERRDSEFSTSVYRKPAFTGQCLRWNSFSLRKRKINLIGTLVHRAFMICWKGKLDPELDKILSILLENGYPENLIKSTIKRKLQQLNSNPVHTVKNAQSTYTFHGSETFRWSSKSRSRLPWRAASFPLNHVLFLRPHSSYQQQRKTCYLPIIKTT